MPKGWVQQPLAELADFYSGGTPNKSRPEFWGGPIPWVTVKDMKAMRLNGVTESLTESGAETVRIAPAGSVLVLVRGMGLFKDLPVVLCDRPVAFNQDIKALVPANGILSEFLAYSLVARKAEILRHVESAGHGTGRLDTDLLRSTPLPIPSPEEQQRIVEILRTWDEAIKKLEVFRAAKQDRLNGLTQQLLGRGGAFPDRWERQPLSAISTRIRRQNGGDNHPVMTISAKSGFLMQSDKFARDMAGRSVDRYIVLHEGEFAYNKGNSLTAPFGCIFRLDRPTALVPFVYYCFALKKALNSEFYAHLFAAGALNHQLSRLINSGVRNDGLLNLNVDDFFDCKVPVPPIKEQGQIARALTAAKDELALLDKEIEAVQRQKRGLMQKLLTGEWRVPC